jgi:hypothetical protein
VFRCFPLFRRILIFVQGRMLRCDILAGSFHLSAETGTCPLGKKFVRGRMGFHKLIRDDPT